MYNLLRQVSTCTVQCLLLMYYELCTSKLLVFIIYLLLFIILLQ